MSSSSRRDFLKAGLAATALPAVAASTKGTASDWVTLGKSNVTVTRLAFGTGTHSGAQQRHLGQEEFTRLIRYAYDNGIRFFETADAYQGMPEMLAVALKGIPRDSYRLMTKYDAHHSEDPMAAVHRLTSALGTPTCTVNGAEVEEPLLTVSVSGPGWPAKPDMFSEPPE